MLLLFSNVLNYLIVAKILPFFDKSKNEYQRQVADVISPIKSRISRANIVMLQMATVFTVLGVYSDVIFEQKNH